MPSLSNLTTRFSKLTTTDQASFKDNDLELIDLPKDLLADILSRLPAESLCRIRLVCKPFSNIIGDRSFIKLHTILLNNSTKNHGEPQIMCFAQDFVRYNREEDGEQEYTAVATLQSVKYEYDIAQLTNIEFSYSRSMSSPVWADLGIDFVFYNLFGMNWHNGRCWLVDPLLKQVLSLPVDDNIRPITKSGPYLPVVIWHGMGYDDITDTYKIVRVSKFYKEDHDIMNIDDDGFLKLTIHIFVLGTDSWREIPSVPLAKILGGFNVSAYGDMHWLTSRFTGDETKKRIVSFDFKKEEFSWTPPPPGLRSSGKNSCLNLLTFRGSMAIVETYPWSEGVTKVEIWLMKNYATKEWTREYNMTFDMHDKYNLEDVTCGEWEHGIFFNTLRNNATRFFLDLRSSTVNIATCPQQTQSQILIMSYTRSLITLSDFGPIACNSVDD